MLPPEVVFSGPLAMSLRGAVGTEVSALTGGGTNTFEVSEPGSVSSDSIVAVLMSGWS